MTEYKIIKGDNGFAFPPNAVAGMYLGKFIPDDGGQISEVRIVNSAVK
jgi:hypothetical protein